MKSFAPAVEIPFFISTSLKKWILLCPYKKRVIRFHKGLGLKETRAKTTVRINKI